MFAKSVFLAAVFSVIAAAACSGGPASVPQATTFGARFAAASIAGAQRVAQGPAASPMPRSTWPPAGFVFMRDGAWARKVPSNPPVAPQSSTWLDHLFNAGYDLGRLQFEADSQGGNGDGNAPVYYATSADPAYTIHCVQFTHCPEEGRRVNIPVRARPSDGGDHRMAIVNRKANREDDFWLAAAPGGKGGKLDIGYGGHGALDGDGTRFSATASGVALTPGLLRETDLMSGSIPHALYISAHCTAAAYVFPAVGSDDDDSACAPQGTRLYLDVPQETIAAQHIPAWAKTYLNAWHTFGAIISDHGGDNFALMLEHDYTYSVLGGGSPWLAFATFVQNDPASRDVWAQPYDNVYHIVFPTGTIDLRKHLKALQPCVNTGTC